MFFLMVCSHKQDIEALRDELRPQHRQWVASGGNGLAKVLTGSAIWSDDGQGVGNFGILEAADEQNARRFAEGDPFFVGGIIENVEIRRIADAFQAHRIDPLTHR